MNKTEFINELQKLGITITEEELNKFETYKNLLQEYNKKFNLTSIIEDDEIYLKHFYDSLCILKSNKILSKEKILDIGVGAGFPSIPLAIIKKDLNITLIESNTKKCEFLKVVKKELNLNNIEIINERAEEYALNNREKFDIATSRAVAPLQILLELEIPMLKTNGYFIPLKSNIEEELKNSTNIIKALNVIVEDILNYELPNNEGKRTLLIIKKLEKTNTLYPRPYNKILKSIKK